MKSSWQLENKTEGQEWFRNEGKGLAANQTGVVYMNPLNKCLKKEVKEVWPELRYLDVSKNELRGIDPSIMELMEIRKDELVIDLNNTGVQYLFLSEKRFSKFPQQAVNQLKALQHFSYHNSDKGGIDLNYFCRFPELIILSVGTCKLTEQKELPLCFQNLKTIRLSGQCAKFRWPDYFLYDDVFSAIDQLVVYDGATASFNRTLPYFHNSSKLKELELLKLGLIGKLAPEYDVLLRDLRLLDLSYNKLEGKIPSWKFNRLEALRLKRNLLVGEIPKSIFGGTLEKIDLSQNANIAGTLPPLQKNYSSLRCLDIRGTGVNGFGSSGNNASVRKDYMSRVNITLLPWQPNFAAVLAFHEGCTICNATNCSSSSEEYSEIYLQCVNMKTSWEFDKFCSIEPSIVNLIT